MRLAALALALAMLGAVIGDWWPVQGALLPAPNRSSNQSPITLLDAPWRAVPAAGVEMRLTQSNALQVDFDFHGHAGYAISRRDGRIELPDNFELAFRVKGDAPRNTLEIKFVQGENVWWTTRREFDFPREWQRVSIKKHRVEFAWGPAGPSPLSSLRGTRATCSASIVTISAP